MKENKLVELSMDFSVDMIGCLCVYTECNDEEPLIFKENDRRLNR